MFFSFSKSRKHFSKNVHRSIRFETLEDRSMLSCTVLNADFNNNGTIDGPDLPIWESGYGTSGTATQMQGDADGDSDVDGADFLAWQRTLNDPAPTSSDCIDIQIDGQPEAVEESPGAIVFRNSDFSKESLAANQPETGLPLYVPDYAAPLTVYDPNAAADFTTATVGIDDGMIGQYEVRFTFDNTKIQLWTTSTWGGLDNVGGGRSRVPNGVDLTPNSDTLDFQIEGLDVSTAFATDSISVEAIPNGGGDTLDDQANYTVVEVNAAVDGNRDTSIDFSNSHDRQLLFWFNNDQEGFHVSDTDVESEQPDITSADNTDNVITQRRDLEDLAPLRTSVDPLLVANTFDTSRNDPPPAGAIEVTYQVRLVNPGGASLRLFFANNTQPDAYRHVNNEATADVQATDAFFRTATTASFTTQPEQLEQTSGGVNAFLFEAAGPGYTSTTFTATPTLEFETLIEYPDGTTTSKVHPIELDLRAIKTLYTRWMIPYLVGGNDLRTDVTFQHFATPTAPIHTSTTLNEPFFSGDDTVVLVHGWNMTDTVNNDWKAAFAETMYKRLYWQGFRGEFASFDWPTFADSENPRAFEFLNLTYNPSDFQAYRSARALKEVLATYRGEAPNLQPVHLLAHSMGNIVAGEALRQWTFDVPINDDPLVTNYVAMQAAVSAGPSHLIQWTDDSNIPYIATATHATLHPESKYVLESLKSTTRCSIDSIESMPD